MNKNIILASVSVLCMGAVAAPAMAQSVYSGAIEELVVTARKTEEKAQDVPVAITAISPTRMKDLVITNMTDVSHS